MGRHKCVLHHLPRFSSSTFGPVTASDLAGTVLKFTPVGELWVQQLQKSNPLQLLAKSTENGELFEYADDISTALQIADQFVCKIDDLLMPRSPFHI